MHGGGEQVRVVVDQADDGPWIKILQYGNDPYTPTAAASGELTCAYTQEGFAKLSDRHINRLAGDDYYLRVMSKNTSTYLYLHVRGAPFADDQYGFGFANSVVGCKVARDFGGAHFTYKNSLQQTSGGKEGFDTWERHGKKATEDDSSRWWVDGGGHISSGYRDTYRGGVRSFNQGYQTSPRWAMRVQVSIWLKKKPRADESQSEEPSEAPAAQLAEEEA